jgi:CRP-like cAMP-binding protein
MTIEDDIAFLERVPILRRLGVGALRILAIGAESYTVAEGQVLFSAGDIADCAYVVQDGSFSLDSGRPNEPEMIAGSATLLGEAALLAETIRPATAIAREPSLVLRISRAMFIKMLESFPDAALRLRELIATRADQWAREMENVRAALARGTGPQ